MTSEKQTVVTIGPTQVPIGKFLKSTENDCNNPLGVKYSLLDRILRGWEMQTLTDLWKHSNKLIKFGFFILFSMYEMVYGCMKKKMYSQVPIGKVSE